MSLNDPTACLRLRPIEVSDVEALHSYQQLEDVARYQFWEPRTLESVRDKVQNWSAMRHIEGEGTLAFAVVETVSGQLIGDASLSVSNAKARQGCVGYTISPAHQGKGYATDTGKQLLKIGFEDLGLHRIFAMCHVHNTPSWRVMERLGMRREAHFREHALFKGAWDEEYCYAILEDEWRAGLVGQGVSSP